MRPVEEDLGGRRCVVASRHGHKGGHGRSAQGHWLLQRCDHSGRVGLRDAESLGQGRQGAGRGITESAERREEGGEKDVHPLMGFALAHAKQAPLYHLERVGFARDQEEEPPLFRRRSGAVLVHRKPAGRPRLPVEAPRRQMRVKRGLKGWDRLLKLVERHAGHRQELRGAGLHVGEPYTGPMWCLLAWEAQSTINRAKLKR